MASVTALPNLEACICLVRALHPRRVFEALVSHPVGITTHTHTQHSVVVDAETQIAVSLDFGPDCQPGTPALPGDFVEVLVRFNGAVVFHKVIPVADFIALQGRMGFFSSTAPNGDGDALKVDRIDVVVTHRSLESANAREQTAASQYTAYTNPLPSTPEHYTKIGESGQFTFHCRDEGEEQTIDPSEPRYCKCNDVGWGTMVACDNGENCEKEYFHLLCVRRKHLPAKSTKWNCPDCRKKLKSGGSANGNANVPHDRTSTFNANTNDTSTTNPPNPSTSSNSHATPPAYPTYGSNAYGAALPPHIDQGAPAGHIYREEVAPSNEYTRPPPSAAPTDAIHWALLSQQGDAARAPRLNGRTGVPAMDDFAGWSAYYGERASSRRAASGAGLNGMAGAIESRTGVSQNASLAQRGEAARASNANATSAAAESTIATQQYTSQAQNQAGDDPLNEIFRAMASTSASYPTLNATENRPATRQTISQAQTPASTGRGHGSSASNDQLQLPHLDNTIHPPSTRSAPSANAQRQRPAPNFARETLNSNGQSTSSGTTRARSRLRPTSNSASRPPMRWPRAQLRPAPTDPAARPAPATNSGEALGRSPTAPPLAAVYASYGNIFPAAGDEVDLASQAAAVFAFIRGHYGSGGSSSSAGPPSASQSSVSDLTGEYVDARSINNRNNYLALQAIYRRDAALPAPVDASHADLEAALAACDEEARANQAAAIAALVRGASLSSSAGPPTASQSQVFDLTGEDGDARSRNNNTNYLALQNSYRQIEPPAPVDEAVADRLAARNAMRAAHDLARARQAAVNADIEGRRDGGASPYSAAPSLMARAVANGMPASWAHNPDMVAMYAAGRVGRGSSSSSSSTRPTTASQRRVIDPTGSDADAGSGNDNTDSNTLAPLNFSRSALPPPLPVLVDANYPGSASDYAAALVARTEALHVHAHSAAMADSQGGSGSGTPSSPTSARPTPARNNTTPAPPTGSRSGLVTIRLPAVVDRAAPAAGFASAARLSSAADPASSAAGFASAAGLASSSSAAGPGSAASPASSGAAVPAPNARLARHRARDAVVAAELADDARSSDDEEPPRKKRKGGDGKE